MRRALELAATALYHTDPNPRVGCVLVRDGQIIGEGVHRRAGGAHAETHALEAAGEAARGADCFVTLEPCNHHGRTPPCSEALIAAGVSRVVIAMEDHDAQAKGGTARLREAGITVESGLLAAAARELNIGFHQRCESGRPWLRLKLAASIDGRTAAADGGSQWITSSAARDDVQHWRARSSVIATGGGTVRSDNPRLNVRHPDATRQPLRAIVTRAFDVPVDAHIFDQPGEAWVYGPRSQQFSAAGKRLQQVGRNVCPLDDGADGLDLTALVRRWGEMKANEVLLECGAGLAGAFLAQDLIDEVLLYQAPMLLGHRGRELATLPGLTSLDQALRYEFHDYQAIGDDMRLTLRRRTTHV